jgi:hypothetical protein
MEQCRKSVYLVLHILSFLRCSIGGMLDIEVFTDATGLDVIVVVEADNNRVVRIN